MTDIAHLTDEELQRDVQSFVDNHIPSIAYEDLIRAARVAKDIRLYDKVAREEGFCVESDLLVQLTEDEKRALRRERDVPFSEKGMRVVIITVSIAALLQGGLNSPSTLLSISNVSSSQQASFNRRLMVQVYIERSGGSKDKSKSTVLRIGNSEPLTQCPSLLPHSLAVLLRFQSITGLADVEAFVLPPC